MDWVQELVLGACGIVLVTSVVRCVTNVAVSTTHPRTSDETQIVLQVLPALEGGGVERGTVDVAQMLSSCKGVRGLVVSSGGRMASQLDTHLDPLTALAVCGGVHPVLDDLNIALHARDPIHVLWNGFRLGALIIKEKIALVHARSRAVAWSALGSTRWIDIPFVTTWHGTYGDGHSWKRYYNRVMLCGDLVITPSCFVATHILNVYGGDQSRSQRRALARRLRVIPRGVDLDTFDPRCASSNVDRVAREWGLKAGERRVLVPARLARWKGHKTLLRALEEDLHVEGVLCVLFLGVGSNVSHRRWKDLNQLAESVRRRGHRVLFLPWTEDAATAYMLADVVAIPSERPEAFGRVAIEALAMGCPIVAFDHGGVSETLRQDDGHPVPGTFLVPPNNIMELHRALRDALSCTGPRRHEAAIAMRTWVTSRFSLHAMCTLELAVYKEAIAIHERRTTPQVEETPRIRVGLVQDAPCLALLVVDVMNEGDLNVGRVAAVLNSHTHCVQVAVDSTGSLVGFCDGFVTAATRWEVDLLGVMKEHRGRGWGRRLVEASLEAGRARGATMARALIRRTNDPSEVVFKANGFHPSPSSAVELFVTQQPASPCSAIHQHPDCWIHSVATLSHRSVWVEVEEEQTPLFVREALECGNFMRRRTDATVAGIVATSDGKVAHVARSLGWSSVGPFRWWKRHL